MTIMNEHGRLPQLPTTVVGSYSVPEWLERLKTEYYQRRISRAHLSEIHDVAIKAAIKDQECAGIDIVSDGERIRRALEYVEPARLMINPDCGLRHLAPDVARQKLRAMVSGAALVRSELGLQSSNYDSQSTGDNNG